MGLLRGIELVKDRETREPHHELGALTTERCLQLGLSMNIRRRPERGSVWRIAPPLTVKREDIDLAMTIFDQALTEMKEVRCQAREREPARRVRQPETGRRMARCRRRPRCKTGMA